MKEYMITNEELNEISYYLSRYVECLKLEQAKHTIKLSTLTFACKRHLEVHSLNQKTTKALKSVSDLINQLEAKNGTSEGV